MYVHPNHEEKCVHSGNCIKLRLELANALTYQVENVVRNFKFFPHLRINEYGYQRFWKLVGRVDEILTSLMYQRMREVAYYATYLN